MELINCLKHIFLGLGFIVLVLVLVIVICVIHSLSGKSKIVLFNIRHNTSRKKKGYLKK